MATFSREISGLVIFWNQLLQKLLLSLIIVLLFFFELSINFKGALVEVESGTIRMRKESERFLLFVSRDHSNV